MSDALALSITTPMQLITKAAANGATIEQMTQLFELKRSIELDDARKAFNVAMAQFKRDPPTIRKNKHVTAGPMQYDHATLDHVVQAIVPALSRVGIRHRWEPDQSKPPAISITCILSHDLGHSEQTTLTALADVTGSKNGIQAIGSAVTYLQRYTLLAATGLAAGGTDDDALATHPVASRMSDTDYLEWIEAIDEAQTTDAVVKAFQGAYKEAKALGDNDSIAKFIVRKDARKAQL